MNTHLHSLRWIIITVSLAATCIAQAGANTSVSRHGVTWIFDQNYETGTYANGDPWVIGPVTITKILPASNQIAGKWVNGTMLNPSLGPGQGFDGRLPSNNPYSDSSNVARQLPMEVPADSSLISSISNPNDVNADGTRWGQIQSYSVLTVVGSAPPTGSFRPPYMGSPTRESKWRESDLDYGALGRLPKLGLNPPSINQVASDFEKVWFEKDLLWTGRRLHTPYQAYNGYGKEMAIKTGNAALLLNLDFSDAEKRDLLIYLVQYGIDISGILAAGGQWIDTGGHNPGRLAPILVAAATLKDAELRGRCVGSEMNFSEFRQTFFVSQKDVDTARYTADGRPRLPYTAADIGMPEWGETHTRNPSRDGNNWSAYYRDICGGQLTAPAMAARVMGLRDLVNWEPFFQYQERHLNYEQSAEYGNQFNSNPTPTFHKQFYNAFRDITSGPTPVPGEGGAKPAESQYSLGDRILGSDDGTVDIKVYESATLASGLLGTQGKDIMGTIDGGPVGPDSNGDTWWRIDYDSGVDGWIRQPIRVTDLRTVD